MADNFLLKEDGGKLLKEDGGGILLESSTPSVTKRVDRPFAPTVWGPKFEIPKKVLQVRKGFTTFQGLFPANSSPILRYTYPINGILRFKQKLQIIANPILLETFKIIGPVRMVKIFKTEGRTAKKISEFKEIVKEKKKKRLERMLKYLDFLDRI
ncbi:MAG: hypothetical protein ACE5H1_10615 [Thermodesulfobacteriota bacterium]